MNRNTFYAHYATPEDVLAEIKDELVTEFEKVMYNGNKNTERKTKEDSDPLYFMKKNHEVHKILMENRSSRLRGKMYRIRLKYYREYYSRQNIRSPFLAEQIYLYTSAGATQICENWISGGCRESVEEIEEIMNTLRRACIDAYRVQ